MPRLEIQIPSRIIEFTHVLLPNSNLYTYLPTEYESMSPKKGTVTLYVGDDSSSVKMLDYSIGINGLYSKILKGSETFYVLTDRLVETEELSEQFSFVTPNSTYIPPRGIFPEEGEIVDWNRGDIETSIFDPATQTYYCSVETVYDGEGITNEQIEEFSTNSFIRGLQIIFKANGKKSDEDYIQELVDTYYFMGAVREWSFKERPCTNFYALVTIPKKLLYSAEVIDYRDDPEQAAKDGVGEGALAPGSQGSDIVSAVRYSFLNFEDFANQINDLANIIDMMGEQQLNFAAGAADEYMGALDASEYIELIDLDLKKESKKFNDKENGGNFLNTIRSLLEINGLNDLDRKYDDATKNNIFFGLDKDFNIIYIDILRNNKLHPLVVDGFIFDNPFGDYGVTSRRSGFFLFNFAAIKSIYLTKIAGDDWNQELANGLDYTKFVEKFVIPPPKEINLPKRDLECAKNNIKKLWQDGVIKTLGTAREISELVEFNVRKNRLERNLENKEFQSQKDNFSNAQQRQANMKQPDDEQETYGDTMNAYLKSAGIDLSKPYLTALNELKKICRSTAFQRALLQRIICIIKDMNNQQATSNLDKAFNSELKKQIQDALTKLFCSPFMDMLLKALAAYKVPKFKPMDLNKAFREALSKAIVETILEIYNILIKELIKALADCGKEGANTPFNDDQAAAIQEALDNALNNSDDPFSSDSLGGAYDATGIPQTDASGPGAAAERSAAKQQLQDIVADMGCILNPAELCRLMDEGIVSDEVYGILRSLIARKFPELEKYLRTKEQIASFFTQIGAAIGVAEICANLNNNPSVGADCICDTGEIEKNLRDALKQNNLTPEQIDAIIDDANKKRQKRLDDLLEAINNRPEEFPLVCRGDGQPGMVNVAEVDQTYADQVQNVVEGSLAPVYESFNSDAGDWASNMMENPRINFTTEELMKLNKTKDKESAKAMQEVLIQKQILVPIYDTEETTDAVHDGEPKCPELKGTPNEPKMTKKTEMKGDPEVEVVTKVQDQNFWGSPVYLKKIPRFIEEGPDKGDRQYQQNPNPPSEPPVIAPVLIKSLERPDNFEIGKNNITVRVNCDFEREKFRALFQAQLDLNIQDEIRRISTEKMANIYLEIANNLAAAAGELLAQLATGGIEDDPGFWIGWGAVQKKHGDGNRWLLTTLPAAIMAVYELLDVFFADITDRDRDANSSKLPTQFGTSFLNARTDYNPRQVAYTRTGNVTVSRLNSTMDKVQSPTGNSVGTIQGGIVSFASSNEAYIAYLEEDKAKLLDKEQVYTELIQNISGSYNSAQATPEETEAFASAEQSATEALEETVSERQETQQEISQTQEDLAIVSGNAPMTSSQVFDSVDNVLADIKGDLKSFEESFVFKAVMNVINSITQNLADLKNEVSALYSGIEQAKTQIANLDHNFPNYDITYTHGTNINNENQIEILKNKKSFVKSKFKEDTDSDVEKFIEDNNLKDGFNGSTSLEEHVFNRYMSSRGINADYNSLKREFFEDIYANLEDSVYRKIETKASGSYLANMSKLKPLLIESPTSEFDAYCGISNNSLDLDEILDDTMKDFISDKCNHQPPNPNGGPRGAMNPVESAISFAFMIATVRVYLYDYYLKGVFLFDRYRMGMTATDPMIEFLADCFETEMRSFEPDYFNKFLKTVLTFSRQKYRDLYEKLELEMGKVSFESSYAVKKFFFKKLIKEELLYISFRLSPKIKTMAQSVQPIPNSDPEMGKIFDFFLNRAKSKKTLNAVKNSSGRIDVVYNNRAILPNVDKNNAEYKLLFEYCLPVRKYISMVVIHTIMASNARVQSNRTFLATKALLKSRHNSVMAANGYKNNKDLAAGGGTTGKLAPGAGDQESAGTYIMALILKTLIKVPLDIIKNLCETGDFNVFLASLPYKIAKPITLALMNQIPMWATQDYIKNAPPKSPENEFGFPVDPLASLKRAAYFLPVSGFVTIPIIGAALLWAFIIPSPFGIAYYSLGCWYDSMVDNTNMDIAQDAAATKLLEGRGIVVDKCNIAKMRKMQSKPDVERAKLLETEYV